MEQISREDIERLMFFEQAREQAESAWNANKQDDSALTRWGGALLELAHFRQGPEASEMIDEAISKFQEALEIAPQRHDTLWCLGNAYTSLGFLTTHTSKAHGYFEQAGASFKKAMKEDPGNDTYRKALEMTMKAPALHAELQKQYASSGSQGGGASSSAAPDKASNDVWYDVAGWFIFAGILVGISAFSWGRAGAGGAMSTK